MIVAKGLSKSYDGHPAVQDLSFTVPKGAVVGFLGPNGAGKSTTLRMVSGFLPPTSGSVSVAGFDVVEEPLEARRHLGYMPQKVPLYDEMRVGEYLHFRAELKGVARRGRKAAVERAMEQARVADRERYLISDLSEGYRQRVGLADALVASPPLLILDEPTASLDPNQKLEVRELLRSLAGEHTIFLSTHILPEVEAVCSRVVILHRGRIAAEGTPEELRRRLTTKVREVLLTVRGDDEKVRAAVSSVPGLSVHEVRAEEEAGVRSYELSLGEDCSDPDGATESLAQKLVSAGLGLRRLEARGTSLEELFHELTGEEPPAEEESKKEEPS